MKNTGICPKCQSNEIVHIKDQKPVLDGDNNIQLGATIFSEVIIERLVCLGCGYLEHWIEHEQDLDKIRKKYS